MKTTLAISALIVMSVASPITYVNTGTLQGASHYSKETLTACDKAPNCEITEGPLGPHIGFKAGMEPGSADYSSRFSGRQARWTSGDVVHSRQEQSEGINTNVEHGPMKTNYGNVEPRDVLQVLIDNNVCGILILITGVSGHVGFRTLVEALSRNYRVRAVVRKEEQKEQILNTKSIKPLAASLEFVVVKDLLKEGAFDNVLGGVSGVLHIASPLPGPTDNYKRDMLDPSINATLGVLKSAAKAASVRRIVITSSIAAMITLDYLMSNDFSKVFTANDVYPTPVGITEFASPIEAYSAAKNIALSVSEEFVKNEKPQFDVISILPSMVIGKNELNTKKEELEKGTNGLVIGPLVGHKADMPTLGSSVHLHDVARMHVDALNPAVPGNIRLLCSSGGQEGVNWDDAKDIAKSLYGKQVPEAILPLTGSQPTRPIRFDSSDTEKLLGWKFAGFEEQVKSVADHYIELASA